MQLIATTIRRVNHKRHNPTTVLHLDFSARVPFRFCFEKLSREDASAPTKQIPPRGGNNVEDKIHWSLDSDGRSRQETLDRLLREMREDEELAKEEEEERQAEEQSLQVLEELADEDSHERARDTIISWMQGVEVN